MKLKVFCVFDSKVGAYQNPFVMRSKGEALRGFIDVANDPQSNICKYPSDYTLFELGDYDDEHAWFDLHKTPISLGLALDFKKDSNLIELPAVEKGG